jgi:hypothetical protein
VGKVRQAPWCGEEVLMPGASVSGGEVLMQALTSVSGGAHAGRLGVEGASGLVV